ncbi:MAG: hypothetical protein KF805_13300 [Phycisphaeraceae bacterium]|nr:hypothetical protein [Phycisphaeraceae bacterium]
MSFSQSRDAFQDRGQSLEEGYFRTRDAQLVDKLRNVFEAKVAKDAIRNATGITDETFLDRMLELNIKGEMLTAFKLFPLVEVAWADGSFDQAEADAVIAAAAKQGIPRNSEVLAQLKEWLKKGPTPDGRALWKMYAAELRKTLTPAELATFRDDMVKHAHSVAQASGGILKVFLSESREEKRAIQELKKDLTV